MSRRTRPGAAREKRIRAQQATRQWGANFQADHRVRISKSPNWGRPNFHSSGDLCIFVGVDEGPYVQNLTAKRSTNGLDRPVGTTGHAEQALADAVKSGRARDSIETEFWRQLGVPVRRVALADV